MKLTKEQRAALRESGALDCAYCGHPTELVADTAVYARSYGGSVYLCRPCKAWVGCHKGTTRPLGRVAKADLRSLKICCHALFDPIWKTAKTLRGGSNSEHRKKAYQWLAEGIGIPFSECHFGLFDESRARAALSFLQAYHAKLATRSDQSRAECVADPFPAKNI